MLWFGAAAYIKQQQSAGCGRSYIGAKSYGNIEEGRNVTHTLDDENEEVTSDDENEEVISDDDEIEEVVLDDKNEEVTSDDENEQVTSDDEIEEVVLDDENDHEEGTNDGKTKNKDVSATKSDTGNECFQHFVESIVDGDEKAHSSVALSCLEATFHVLRQQFPHVRKVILQSDNAKTFGGNVTTQLLSLVAKAAGLECIGYYHNEAGTGKDVCDTHFSHQQARVNAYISEGSGGRNVSTPRQLVAALTAKLIKKYHSIALETRFQGSISHSNS